MSRQGHPRVLQLLIGFDVGGAETLVLESAPRLARLGFDVRAAALKGPGPVMAGLEAAGIPCAALGATSRLDAAVVARLARLLRRERIDVLHSHMFLANVAGRIAGRVAGVPAIVASHHDTDVWMGPHHRVIERATARLGDRVAACSEAVREFAVRRVGLPPDRVVVLRNGIAIPGPAVEGERARARAGLGAAPDDLLVGTLGRLDEPKKGLAVLLRAAPAVLERVPSARFVIAGEGPARGDLESQAARAGLGGRVLFAGLRRDVPALLSAYDLFVQPSLWEGFGLTLVEAMAMGRAVVASEIGGIPSIVRRGVDGTLVPPGDARALAGAVADLLLDARRRELFGLAGRERAIAEFGIDRLVAETAALYGSLLRGSAPGRAPARARRRVA